MRGDCDQRAGAGASAKADHITFGVDFDVAQPALAQHFHEYLGAFYFFERGCFDLGDLDSLPYETIVIFGDKLLCGLKFRIHQEALNIAGLSGRRSSNDSQQQSKLRNSRCDPGKQLSPLQWFLPLSLSSASRKMENFGCGTATGSHQTSRFDLGPGSSDLHHSLRRVPMAQLS